MGRQVSYERTLSGSFMKVTAADGGLDGIILDRISVPGFLSKEKCFMDGMQQYWFSITGKQSLDTFCNVTKTRMDFIEKIVISVCREIEAMENYLLDPDCLILDPEMIFISNSDHEIYFAALGDDKRSIDDSFRQLMEYLLTKIDHEDKDAVHAAYGLYEKTLEEGYSIADMKNAVIEVRQKAYVEKNPQMDPADPPAEKYGGRMEEAFSGKKIITAAEEKKAVSDSENLLYTADKSSGRRKKKSGIAAEERKSLAGSLRGMLERLFSTSQGEEEFLLLPDMQQEEAAALPENPTVCLTASTGPQGILLYEGNEAVSDIYLTSPEISIGKGEGCSVQIQRDTVSFYHARITSEQGRYLLEDLNSTNGTFVNGNPLSYRQKQELKANDIVRIADLRFRFI